VHVIATLIDVDRGAAEVEQAQREAQVATRVGVAEHQRELVVGHAVDLVVAAAGLENRALEDLGEANGRLAGLEVGVDHAA